jgi:hypothetical protein
MRPIEKKRPGELIQYKDSRGNIVNHVVQKSYSCYGDAKLPLVGNLDRYCSYCEGPREIDSLEVEHRVARNNGGSETDWDNFLLCCKVCNTIKSTADVGECHWPHLDNTFLDFIYQEDGRVKLNPELSGLSRIKAQNLYNLVKLGRSDNGATPKDFRWQRRYETWNKAKKVLAKYDDGKLDENDMIGFAKSTGYWSIWFIVFENKEEIRSRLISDFSGTCRSCFDANNHYSPVPRN